MPWAILPAAFLWGASFPLALAAVASRGQDPGRLVGGVYAANTFGAIVGALGFSMLVIPSRHTVGAAVADLAVRRGGAGDVGAASLAVAGNCRQYESEAACLGNRGRVNGRDGGWRLARLERVPGSLGDDRLWPFLATWVSGWCPGLSLKKMSRSADGTPDMYCTYIGEGMNVSVAVTMSTAGVRNFHGAGKVQASNDPHDMRLQRMLGHISALAHRNPESVLVVACGAGVTAGSFVLYPSIKRIVICDIEPLVPKFVAPMFKKENYGVVDDPRTEVILDDGRHFIRTTTGEIRHHHLRPD